MKCDLDFAMPIKTINGFYVYDANVDDLIEIDSDLYEYLVGDNLADENIRKTVLALQEQGYLLGSSIKEILHPYTNSVENYLGGYVRQLCLQVTQNCNLRCSYCIYSGKGDKFLQRSHTNKYMSIETALRAVNFLYEKSTYSKTIEIGFYGGEPLLAFPLIKEVVNYVEKIFEGKKIRFSLTTNATLLTEEVIDFFSEHSVWCMISLDGPKKIQNKNRKDSNGNGSFDQLIKNVDRAVEKYPDYREKLSLSMVLDPQNSFEEINKLFEMPLFHGLNVNAVLIDTIYFRDKNFISGNFITQFNYHAFLSILASLGKLEIGKISPVFGNTKKF